MRRKEKREFWDRLFPKTSNKVQERKYFGLVHGATDADPTTGEPLLKYFASHADTRESTISVDELQTGRSEEDLLLKLFVYGYQLFLAIAAILIHFLSEAPSEIQFSIASSFSLLVFLGGVFIWFNLRVHFNDMNTEWVEAIKGIVSVDMTALIGKKGPHGFEAGAIADCMLIFRRFIKWRRYMNFFEPLLAISVTGEIAVTLYLVASGHATISSIEVFLLILLYFLQVATYLRVSFLRWYWTKWRDPTVQLCLAFASLDRQLWVAKHPAAQGRIN